MILFITGKLKKIIGFKIPEYALNFHFKYSF
jgi:hypothetical protein